MYELKELITVIFTKKHSLLHNILLEQNFKLIIEDNEEQKVETMFTN